MVIDKIKEICEKKGMSIAELGRMIGTGKSTIHTIMTNGNPTVETLEKIAKALDVNVRDFFEEEPGEVFTCPHCHQPIRDRDFINTVKTQEDGTGRDNIIPA